MGAPVSLNPDADGRNVRRIFWALLLIGGSGAALAQDRPNIILIFSDDHALRAVSAYGDALIETPGVDRIAEEGMLFRHATVTNSICGPSRAALLTGKFSHLNGIYANGEQFDGSQPTLPKYLQAHGYETAIIGKWHLGSEPTGFDHWEVLPGQGSYFQPTFISERGETVYGGYVTDVIGQKTIDWLEHQRAGDRPFFLMSQHKAPHRGWMPPVRHLNLYVDEAFPEPDTLFDTYEGRASGAAQQEMTLARHFTFVDLKIMPDANDLA
ncbi:MAG: sulfatase-like hydrolase/transferase, partial [Rhodospirillaceae bacterium]|nr:sulfatase-like hydrolase/transferase [Rhodospirillaceae bacterium]